MAGAEYAMQPITTNTTSTEKCWNSNMILNYEAQIRSTDSI